MLGPRWKKVFSDLWINKTRTVLVVASIWIGVFATGVINGSRSIVVNELQASYQDTAPAHSTVYVSDDDSFGDDLVEAVRKIDGVADAEGRRMAMVSIEEMPGTWQDMQLMAIPDFDDIRINKIRPVQGARKPRDKEVLLERSSVEMLHVAVGESIVIERADGKQKIMQVAGVVHDLSVQPTSMSGRYYGFVTPGTMEWLGEKNDYTRMLIRVAKEPSPAEGPAGMALAARGDAPVCADCRVLGAVEDKVKKSDRDPQMPRGPHGGPSNEHWATSFISNLSMMMSVLGVMSLFLSGFLVTNTIAALLAQQIRQIGIMKAIGARNHQMMGMYMVLVLGFGALAMLLALPLTMLVTRVFVTYVANYFNFDLSRAPFPPPILLIQAFASLCIPVLASLVPVFTGTRITVYEAINNDSIAQSGSSSKKKKKLTLARVSRVGMVLSTILNRPLLLSIRNTFRRKARVALTLLTLTFGGMIFIGIFTIRNSLVLTLDDFISREFQFDLVVIFDRTYRDYYVIDAVVQSPGITHAESWSDGSASRVYDDGEESEDISLTALPPTTTMLTPMVVDGRWLLPDDENALVITTGVLEKDPDIAVGDTITLKINERESGWRVVGITTGIGDSREAYIHYDYFNRLTGQVGKTRMLRVQTEGRTLQAQQQTAVAVQTDLKRQGIDVDKVFFMTDMRERVVERFDFIVMALMSMAMLMAIVGGLGLAGTMSLNVIERTKEIGIMRAIGASNGMMLQIFLGEGLIIGVLSWLAGSSLALPMSKMLCDAMGQLFFRTPLSFSFSVRGVFIWLGFSVVLALVSSFVPAWNATRLTVRDVLAYE
ncbi:MAG: ABC transporter permease [Chloroflexaceae bacterium]|nr:ABC transporter permease [Chloroflexaceae bacterium]